MNWVSILLIVISVMLSACAPPPKAAVQQRDTLSTKQEVDRMGGNLIRIVQAGDTLYGLAFGFGLEINQIAAWNGLSNKSKLKVGQRIRLTEPIGFKYPEKPVKQVALVKPKAKPKAKSKIKLQAPKFGSSSVAKSNQTGEQQATSKQQPLSKSWVWPTQGSVKNRFSLGSGEQGINIQGKRGQLVVAAQTGEVVYAGNGLKGYGNLLIIKHNERYLSAYAHNDELFVGEGQSVQKNTRIATMGVDKSGHSVLHFQIREYGKPVNPVNLLPK